MKEPIRRIAIIGGGPSALFLYRQLLQSHTGNIQVDIFESSESLGKGFPYSLKGANLEHITNVSANEIPALPESVADWMKRQSGHIIAAYGMNQATFNDYKVLPRLLFGKYLSDEFDKLIVAGRSKGIKTTIHLRTRVHDILLDEQQKTVKVLTDHLEVTVNIVVICTGHYWPTSQERRDLGYFASPYPPVKLLGEFNHPVAIRGASLTAIDAIRTLARQHGMFVKDADGALHFQVYQKVRQFKIVLHALDGLLPVVRFHLNDSHLGKKGTASDADIDRHIKENDGFLSLDFIFDKDFKELIRTKDPVFYEKIKGMSMEAFVAWVMTNREKMDPFELLKKEYAAAQQSIALKQSIYWKEALAILSFAMNYPAKHFSAEDMLRLQKILMPLIAIVIAFVPQESCEEMMALHEAGVLEMVSVDAHSKVIPNDAGGIWYKHRNEKGHNVATAYKTFIDCVGQPHLTIEQFPFKGLLTGAVLSPARLPFRSATAAADLLDKQEEPIEQADNRHYYLRVPGIAINDHFQVLSPAGFANKNIYVMAVSYIGGFNPDYSGLDFCEKAAGLIVKALIRDE